MLSTIVSKIVSKTIDLFSKKLKSTLHIDTEPLDIFSNDEISTDSEQEETITEDQQDQNPSENYRLDPNKFGEYIVTQDKNRKDAILPVQIFLTYFVVAGYLTLKFGLLVKSLFEGHTSYEAITVLLTSEFDDLLKTIVWFWFGSNLSRLMSKTR